MADTLTWGDAAQTFVRRMSDGAFIPADPKNSDFAAIDLSDIGAFIPPPAPPIAVTPWQAREALRLAGRIVAVEAAVEALGVAHPAYIAWHYAERIRRDSPLIDALKGGLSLTDADLDALFEVAKGLSL
ncbi:MAG: hypothetical protein ACRC7C_14395 [Beijerinckiaceae bacterium]